IVAYELNNSDNIIAYTSDNQKFTLDPVDDALLFTELNNYSDFLFGGKILSEFEASIYNIDERFFDFEEYEEDQDITIEIDINDLAPFTLESYNEDIDVDRGFQDFLQLSDNIINQYFNNFSNPPTVQPQLLRDTSLDAIWSEWLDSITIEEYQTIKDTLIKEES
ncbi:MAG: hypothetical protein R3321_14935, partial [Nitrososphaeraceae archaeon]|nr:hypothetical protein [Nitrososphaeraceae archaeon]